MEIGVERGRVLLPRLLQAVELIERALGGVLAALLLPRRVVVCRPDGRAIEAVTEVLERVRGTEEVAGMTDLDVRVERKVLVGPFDRRELGDQVAQHLGVHRDLGERMHEAALEPAGRVQLEVGASKERLSHRVERLERRLAVHGRAGVEAAAAGAPEHVVAACDLAGREDAERGLGATEAGRAGLHVGVRDERAHDCGAAGADRLDERDARQRLSRLLRERGRHGDRAHRAHHDERRDVHDLIALGEHPQRLKHAGVEHQRRVRIDRAEDGRILFEHIGATKHHLGHRDRVDHAVEVDLCCANGEVGVLVHR